MAEYIEREQLPLRAEFTPLDDYANGWNDCLNVISEIHAADVQPVVHGKWLPIIEANEYGDVYQCGTYCSECGEKLQSEPNFCPNCGARMDGET